ncbi:MAG TPA: hypothetical protein VFA55_04585 [Candidatus Kapabacteria bacterium]|nr:hypothetical protein [Candidatus Kapabacteria bacterium]
MSTNGFAQDDVYDNGFGPNPKPFSIYRVKNTACYHPSVRRLKTSPPLDSAMPHSTLIAYVTIDSLCRLAWYADMVHRIENMRNDDSLRWILKMLWYMDDYNPTIFYQYCRYGNRVNRAYKSAPDVFFYAIGRAHLLTGDSGHMEMRLDASSHVYHIRIISIQNNGDRSSDWYSKCITATVVDTFKGKTWLPGDDTSSVAPCISFTILPKKQCPEKYVLPKDQQLIDPNGHIIKTYGDFSWQVGSEYEIFLNQDIYSDSTNDYFTYMPLTLEPQGGVYPIINDKVQDYTNYFGMGTSVAVADFEKKIRQTIASITQ